MTRSISRWVWLWLGASLGVAACGSQPLMELQRVRSGKLDVVLLSPRDAITHGKDAFTIEFRSASDGALVDVGDVRAGSASMTMSGTPMFGGFEITRTSVVGRFQASTDLGMAGLWRLTVDWAGPAGQGSATFSGNVR